MYNNYGFKQVSKPTTREWAVFKNSVIKLFYAESFQGLKLGDGNCDVIESAVDMFESASQTGMSEMLVINGVDDESFEPLIINQEFISSEIQYCNTANKPYSDFVKATLLLASTLMESGFQLTTEFCHDTKSKACLAIKDATGEPLYPNNPLGF